MKALKSISENYSCGSLDFQESDRFAPAVTALLLRMAELEEALFSMKRVIFK